jgi:hypothetical protein
MFSETSILTTATRYIVPKDIYHTYIPNAYCKCITESDIAIKRNCLCFHEYESASGLQILYFTRSKCLVT